MPTTVNKQYLTAETAASTLHCNFTVKGFYSADIKVFDPFIKHLHGSMQTIAFPIHSTLDLEENNSVQRFWGSLVHKLNKK